MPSSTQPPAAASDHESCEEDLDQLEMDLSPAPVPQCTPCYECVELKSQLRRIQRMRFRKNEVIKDLRKKLTDLKHNTQELGPVSLTLL